MKIGVSLGSPSHFSNVDKVCNKLEALGYEIIPAGTLSGDPVEILGMFADRVNQLNSFDRKVNSLLEI
jgi:hypothetical protein